MGNRFFCLWSMFPDEDLNCSISKDLCGNHKMKSTFFSGGCYESKLEEKIECEDAEEEEEEFL